MVAVTEWPARASVNAVAMLIPRLAPVITMLFIELPPSGIQNSRKTP
jgi:hypothetical protein